MTKVSDIIKSDLCLGCGLCEAVDKSCKMKLVDKGFYQPNITHMTTQSQQIVSKICPGINVKNEDGSNTSIWGNVEMASNAWAKDKIIRQTSSSGGVTSALAIYLLESHKVDAVLHVGVENKDFLHNKLHISKNREDVLKRNASRYAPAVVFNEIFDILNKNTDDYVFIGKPCDIAGIKNLLKYYPQYKDRIKYFLAIFCAGMPSYNASLKAISTFRTDKQPVSLRYRGNGWPGFFTVTYEDGTSDKMTYNNSWGKILGRQLGFRCKICPDGIGLLADIASGDAWNTKDGYPNFTESDGRNFCFVRTVKGKELFEEAQKAGYIEIEKLHVPDVKDMQRYQFDRRHDVGWRILMVQLMSGGILHFKGLGFIHMAMKANFNHALHDMYGTMKRFYKVKKSNE